MEKMRRPEGNGSFSEKDVIPRSELWTDGLICAFEFVQSEGKSKSEKHCQVQQRQKTEGKDKKTQVPFNGEIDSSCQSVQDNATQSDVCSISGKTQQSFSNVHKDCQYPHSPSSHETERSGFSHWRPIGWNRISELVQLMEPHLTWAPQQYPLENYVDNLTVVDLAAPYWEQPGGSTWWCHVSADHPSIIAWLSNAQWLHPAVSIALRDESRLISERMKYLFYEVPVRVAGGLLFELLGQSVGDPYIDEDDLPVVIRSWQAQNFLVTALHVKGSSSRVNVLGVIEVQELLFAGGCNVPRSSHELIAQLASRLTRWDDRLFRKHIFGEADEIELKFMNRRNHEDMNLFTVILNHEIRRLSRQVIRVKWSLHAREEIVFELLQHLRENAAKTLLEGIRKSTREMIEEQEAVRGRLFTIQDVMQSTVRAWLQI